MKFKTDGIILREQPFRDNHAIVTVLTREAGLLTAFIKNEKSGKKSSAASSRTFCHSNMLISKGKNSCSIQDAEPITVFFGLRESLEKLTLGQYLCEITMQLAPAESGDEAVYFFRLLLGTLRFLSENRYPPAKLKAVFELRALSLAGYMPDLVCCSGCGNYESAEMFFSQTDGSLYCGKCKNSFSSDFFQLSKGVLSSMRFIIYSEFERIFSFSLSEQGFEALNAVTESYLRHQTNRAYASLKFYHSLFV